MNRTIIMSLLAFGLLCGCAQPSQSEDVPQESDEQTQPETADEQTVSEEADITAVWVKEPSMKLDGVYNMEAVPFILGANIEYEGYPVDWYRLDPQGTWDVPAYRNDALTVSYEGKYGIMDYEGNVLFPFVIEGNNEQEDWIPVNFQPFEGFITSGDYGDARKFDAGFENRSFIMSGGVGGYAPSPYVINHQIWIDNLETGGRETFTNTFNRRIAAEITDEDRNPAGCAVIGRDSEIILETKGQCGKFINGFLTVHENSDWLNPGAKGFVRAADGQEITGGPVYEDAMYFEDGYAPVKTDGKWAFIDEDGKPVTKALFDGVSVLNKGRAYVLYSGLWGILDLRATLEKTDLIDEACLGGDYHEQPLNQPEIHEDEPIGTVEVLIDSLNSRSIPSTGGEKKDKVQKGMEYDVYDIYEDTEYTWYRIGEARWIADGGGWLRYAAG